MRSANPVSGKDHPRFKYTDPTYQGGLSAQARTTMTPPLTSTEARTTLSQRVRCDQSISRAHKNVADRGQSAPRPLPAT